VRYVELNKNLTNNLVNKQKSEHATHFMLHAHGTHLHACVRV